MLLFGDFFGKINFVNMEKMLKYPKKFKIKRKKCFDGFIQEILETDKYYIISSDEGLVKLFDKNTYDLIDEIKEKRNSINLMFIMNNLIFTSGDDNNII